MRFSLSLSYFKLYFLNTVRNPPALFFTIIFSPLMLLLTSHQWGATQAGQISAFIIFLNYSVQTISLMLLGMGVSQEKNSEWSKYQRTLPAPITCMLLGRTFHTFFLCLLNLVIVSVVGKLLLSIPVTYSELIYLFVIALIGAIPMIMIGLTIGYTASPESSRSTFTLLNLLLLFGAFAFPSTGLFSYIREAIPTYQWSILSRHIVDPTLPLKGPIVCLLVYTLLFTFLFQKAYLKTRKK